MRAAEQGINEVMADAVLQAKQNHPGWVNRTGTAERSVQVQDVAQRRGSTVTGRWGSKGTNYVEVLERLHGAFLRSAADAKYPGLAAAIRKRLK